MGALGCFLYSFMVKALNTDIDARYTRTKAIQYFCGLFTVVVALSNHLWAATLAWFSTYLGPRIGAEIRAVMWASSFRRNGILI